MKARLRIASSSKETGALLEDYLMARGVILTINAPTVISYGVPHPGALNGICGRGKIFNMRTMKSSGVSTVPFYLSADDIPANAYPLLARSNHGYGGTDIMTVFQPEEIPWRIAAGAEWFSKYVPLLAEYRVWVFRNEVLDTYQKKLNRPKDYKRIGRNYANGFDFAHCANQYDVSREAVKAVQALGLDFAAVDCIRGKDGLIYILETNTAPGVIKSGAQPTLAKLADKMVGWLRGQNA